MSIYILKPSPIVFNEWYMLTLFHKRLILAIGTLLMVFSITLSPLGDYTASAKTLADMNVNEASEAMGHYYALRLCVRRAIAASDFSQETINKAGFFGNQSVILGGQFITNDGDWDGVENCSIKDDKTSGEDNSWVRNGISALGYSDPRDFLCHITNATNADDYQRCRTGQGNVATWDLNAKSHDEREAAYSQSVGQRVFSSSEPANTAKGKIAMHNVLYNTFYKFCQPSDYNGGTVGSNLRQLAIKQYQAGPPATYADKQVVIDSSRLNKETGIIEANPSGISRKLTCKDMPGSISTLADTAQAVLNNAATKPPATFFNNINNPSVNNNLRTEDESASSCKIDGIGWIVCPVIAFLAGITDGAYTAVSSMLVIPAVQTSTSTGNPLYAGWSMMRNFANVAFVIAFLIIIYSQLTGGGMANYTVKKMLPRLVVAAILVNISYWICAVAVDLTNIVGGSVKALFDTITNQYLKAVPGSTGIDSVFNHDGSGIFSNISGAVLAGTIVGATLLVYPAVFLPILVAALAAIVTVLIVLTLRQGLIIILIVISPLAFVAYLLPNTESLFKKWLDLFKVLLFMYPIIAAVFGISAFAGRIIMQSANGNVFVQMMGAGVLVIPLFVAPIIMKAAGGLLNRWAGVVNNPNKGVFDRMRGRAKEVQENSAFMRGRSTRLAMKKSRKNREFANQYELGRKIRNNDPDVPSDLSATQRSAAIAAYYRARGPMSFVDSAAGRATSALGARANQAYNMTGAAGRGEDLSELSTHYKAQVEKATAEAIREAMQTLGKEAAAFKAAGGSSDDFFKSIAVNSSRNQTERDAAVHELARQGRDGALRDLRNGGQVDLATIQEAIGSNAGSLVGKAPDLVKGEGAAFKNVKGSQMAEFTKGTAEMHMAYLDRLKADPSKSTEYTTAINSLNSAMQDIKNDATLQGKFESEVGAAIRNAAAVHSSINTGHIGTDNKIR